MIPCKEAAIKAHKYLEDILESEIHSTIEEVALDDTGDFWLITLNYRILPAGHERGYIIPISEPEKYKLFKINRKDGEVVSMKIRIP